MTKNELLSDYNKVLAENVELQKQLDWYKDYADRLVKHKDMVCLPADLKNLRESNLKLATENEELKKQVEHLLKKVKELSTPEPTEEELNSLFMDKQVNPKDIEFDGDKLVASVEEAASKLKSLKDHNDGKVFDAYGGGSFKSGLACPKCGSELYYNNPNMVLTSYPPKRSVECKNCKHTDYVY
jgi:hypothetical protein